MGYILAPGLYGISYRNMISHSSLSDDTKLDITIADISLGSNLTTNKSKKFIKKSIFNTILGFT